MPFGNLCGTCRDFYWDVHPAFASMEDMVDTSSGSPSCLKKAADVKEGLAVKAGGEKSFPQSTVEQRESSGHTVSRKATILSKSELRAELGKEPKGMIVKGVPCVELPSAVGGGKETFWLFQFDPMLPYRTVDFWYKMEEVTCTNRMRSERQLFAGQPERISAHLGDERLQSASQSAAVKDFVKGAAPHVLSNLKAKAADMIAKAAARKAGKTGDGGDEEEEEEAGGAVIVTAIASQAGAEAAAAAAAAASAAAQPIPPHAEHSPRSAKPQASPDSKGSGGLFASPPFFKKDGAHDTRPASDTASVVSAGGRSMVASVAAAGPVRIDKLDEAGAEMYAKNKMATLDFNAAMVTGKQGVPKHLAADAAQKLQASGWTSAARLIRNRLELFSAAESLQNQSIHSLSPDELAKTIDLLKVGGIEIPGEVHKDLLLYRRNVALRGEATEDTVKELMKFVFPWGGEGDKKGIFDPVKPKAIDLSCPAPWKHTLFATTFGKQCVVPLITAGEKRWPRLSAILSTVTPRVEQVVDNDPSLDDADAACLCDWLTTSRFLNQIMDPVQLLSDDVDPETFDVKYTDGGPIFQAASEAVKTTTEWRDRYLQCAKAMAHVREMAPKYQEHQSALGSATDANRLAVLTAACDDLPRLRAMMPAMLAPLEAKFLKCMGVHIENVETLHAASTLKLGTARDAQALLAKASDSFPFSQEIASWMTTLASIMLEVQAGSTRQEFVEKLNAFNDDQREATLVALQAQLTAARGLDLTSSDAELVRKAVKALERFLLNLLPEQVSDKRSELQMKGLDFVAVGRSLLQFYPSPSAGFGGPSDGKNEFCILLDVTEALFQLWAEHSGATSTLADAGGVVDRPLLDALQRSVLAVQKNAEKLPAAYAEIQEKVAAASDVSKRMVADAVTELQKRNAESVKDVVAHVERILTEEAQTQLWDTSGSKGIKHIMTVLGESIGSVADPMLLKKNVDRLVEATMLLLPARLLTPGFSNCRFWSSLP